MTETASKPEQIAARALTLYTRPSVAMEVVRLTEQPSVDVRALKDCIENDPALTCKILRVVNSSLFGLRGKVVDLNQALALLGIKPLKLLVLGFSLPDSLFAEIAAKQLQWYWTNALTRAVAARQLAEQIWQQPGDEAFIVGLLQDIGILVLVREVGEPYAKFLTGVIDEKCHLATLERETLGFDHNQLSAALLTRWQLPQRLIDTIAAPKQKSRLARMSTPDADLPQILHLAELLVQLVGQRRLRVLPELLEAGELYRGLTKPKLTELVEQLQPQVDQLADVLSLELSADRDYVEVLLESQRQMGLLAEDVVAGARPSRPDDESHAQLLEQSNQLSKAMQAFLSQDQSSESGHPTRSPNSSGSPHPNTEDHPLPAVAQIDQTKAISAMLSRLITAANRCRKRREEFSLLVAEPNVYDVHADPDAEAAARAVRRALQIACTAIDADRVSLIAMTEKRTVAILCGCDRRTTVALAHQAFAHLPVDDDAEADADTTTASMATTINVSACVGVATAAVVSKNFDPAQLLESAERCLYAARTCGVNAVKSIEM